MLHRWQCNMHEFAVSRLSRPCSLDVQAWLCWAFSLADGSSSERTKYLVRHRHVSSFVTVQLHDGPWLC
jgi:hypothetical protein